MDGTNPRTGAGPVVRGGPEPVAGAAGGPVDWQALRRYDVAGMLGAVAAFPHQLEEAYRLGREAANLPRPLAERPRAVIVAGLGGSAIGGDFVAAVLEPEAPVPVMVHRDYGLPGWVGPQDLVFAVSYSGATEETLSAYAAARRRGAAVVAVASGGPLLEQAAADEAAGAPVRRVAVPGGLAPRAALGYLMLPVLYLTCAWTGVGDPSAQVEEAVAVLRRQARELEPNGPEGPAQTLAQRMLDRPLFLYGAGRLGQAAAYRWQCQLNENAKLLAHAHAFPELDHNEVMGWEGAPQPRDGDQRRPLSILLQAPADHPRNRARMEITAELVGDRAEWVTVTAQGQGRLAQLLSLSYLGDFVSVYAALLRGLDPSSIASIQRLKERLAALPAGDGTGPDR
ncbi:bifunctional phosphoglucose/phosphomannose isomerase [Thermaerobacter marianensis DSM 12885]|uniref:Bifunctional phosphoglucose/phosphomannose isomerase n=1 Tax=Thermaerobacter marianensis (strain ATCC 700841 / DSM 12885 / JCM 10246 / 7p75a) TaxID=644966 RepID=E6SGL9_THEM7|nr:bifunctional phosphoglucose/phosphomannose isomerase [Thermaerobacter marianensis]ADU50565.1 bifunctional phosphoglucose/phosphomannose isomerase [Thermaerobacter marianensis DSM 12885]